MEQKTGDLSEAKGQGKKHDKKPENMIKDLKQD